MNFWNPVTGTSLRPDRNLQDYLVQNEVRRSHQQQNTPLSSWVHSLAYRIVSSLRPSIRRQLCRPRSESK
jgi:hypothetical protein